MRKIFVTILSLMLVVSLLVSCANAQADSPSGTTQIIVDDIAIDLESVKLTSDPVCYARIHAFTLEEIESKSDTILVGYISNEVKKFEQEGALDAMVSTITITQVHKGNVKVGEQIDLLEPYFIADSDGNISILHAYSYTPTIPNTNYIFFLEYNDNPDSAYKGNYMLRGTEFSRYPIPEVKANTFGTDNLDVKSLDEKEVGFASEEFLEPYLETYGEVISKYLAK